MADIQDNVDPEIMLLYEVFKRMILKDEQFLTELREAQRRANSAQLVAHRKGSGKVVTLSLTLLLQGYLKFGARAANMVNRRIDTLEEFEATDNAALAKIKNIGKGTMKEILAKRQVIPYRSLSFMTEDMYEKTIAIIRQTRIVEPSDYREIIPSRLIVIRSAVFPMLVEALNEHNIFCSEIIYKEDQPVQ